ncbi:MAG: energy transducer TonB [Woeseiaceae bacterium]|nr:energy transducer TonB [Woeseiaceae bacterium]
MFSNIITAIGSSTAITFSLLFVMNLLINIQPQAVVEPPSPWTINWVRFPEPEEPPETMDPPPSREFVEPPAPPRTAAPVGDDNVIGYRPPTSAPPPVSKYTAPGLTLTDGPMVSLVRPSPVYPARALQEGLDGWVVVQFDVLTDGTVTNISVVESSDRIFEKSARRAAAKFRFKPVVIDGVPQVTTGVRNIFRFRMSD